MSQPHQYIQQYNDDGLFVIKFNREIKQNALTGEVNYFFIIIIFINKITNLI